MARVGRQPRGPTPRPGTPGSDRAISVRRSRTRHSGTPGAPGTCPRLWSPRQRSERRRRNRGAARGLRRGAARGYGTAVVVSTGDGFSTSPSGVATGTGTDTLPALAKVNVIMTISPGSNSRVSPTSRAVAASSSKATSVPGGMGTGVCCSVALAVSVGVAEAPADPEGLADPEVDPVAVPVGVAPADPLGVPLAVGVAEGVVAPVGVAEPLGAGCNSTAGATSLRIEMRLSGVVPVFTTFNCSGALSPAAYRPLSG